MILDQLAKTANEMVADDKGLLAADESTGTIAENRKTRNWVGGFPKRSPRLATRSPMHSVCRI